MDEHYSLMDGNLKEAYERQLEKEDEKDKNLFPENVLEIPNFAF